MHICTFTHKPLPKAAPNTTLWTQTHTVFRQSHSCNPPPQKKHNPSLYLHYWLRLNKNKLSLPPPYTPSLRLCPHPTCSTPPPNAQTWMNPHTLMLFHSKLILLSKWAPSSRQCQLVPFSVSSEKRDSPVHRWIKSFDEALSLVYCHSIYLLACFSSRHWGTLYWIPLPAYTLLSLNLTLQPPPSRLLLNSPIPQTHIYTYYPHLNPMLSLI